MADSSPYDSTLSYLLAQVSRAHRARSLELFDPLDLQPGHIWVLDLLWARDGRSHAEMAQCLCVQAPTLTKWVDRLEVAGLVSRCRDQLDTRVVHVNLTPAGQALHGEIDVLWSEIEAATLRGLSEEEAATLRGLLKRVYRNLDRPCGPGCTCTHTDS